MNFGSSTSSALILKPKEMFFIWLDSVCKANGVDRSEVFFQEEVSIFLIKNHSSFDSQRLFEKYIKYLKPGILKKQLSQYGRVDVELSERVFDQFFDIELRDNVFVAD